MNVQSQDFMPSQIRLSGGRRAGLRMARHLLLIASALWTLPAGRPHLAVGACFHVRNTRAACRGPFEEPTQAAGVLRLYVSRA
jgi:hypothetical protein